VTDGVEAGDVSSTRNRAIASDRSYVGDGFVLRRRCRLIDHVSGGTEADSKKCLALKLKHGISRLL
jgi:hypothetical protein